LRTVAQKFFRTFFSSRAARRASSAASFSPRFGMMISSGSSVPSCVLAISYPHFDRGGRRENRNVANGADERSLQVRPGWRAHPRSVTQGFTSNEFGEC